MSNNAGLFGSVYATILEPNKLKSISDSNQIFFVFEVSYFAKELPPVERPVEDAFLLFLIR